MARLWLLKDCLSLKLWGINLGNIGVLWKMDWILLLMLVLLLMFSVSENVISYWEFLGTVRLQGCLQVDQCSWMLKFPVPHRKWNLAKLSTDPIFISITNAEQLQVWILASLPPVPMHITPKTFFLVLCQLAATSSHRVWLIYFGDLPFAVGTHRFLDLPSLCKSQIKVLVISLIL